MPYLLNSIYLLVLLVLSPWLAYKALTTGKYRRGIWAKLTGRNAIDSLFRIPHSAFRTAWFHGVSVGEIHLLRQIVAAFRRRHPDWRCVISTTTDTGMEEARKHFADLPVIWWPLDFSWAVRRALRAVKPDLVVLAEGEIWPNFLRATGEMHISVAVVNARMSPQSARNYRRLAWLARPTLRRIDLIAAQTEEYAANFRSAGAPPDRVHVTGSAKYDGVAGERNGPRTLALADLFAVKPDDLVWIAGSTQGPEEEIVLGIYRRLQSTFPQLRLFIVPRHRERFDEVANLLAASGQPFLRRSHLNPQSAIRNPQSAIVLLDTIGELGALWGLADVAYVGGSLGNRGGQNMIEPAGYGAAVVFGPHTWNFKETVAQLLAAEAAVQVADAAGLESAVRRLCGDPAERRRLGNAARRLVQQQQGATERTIELLSGLIEPDHLARAVG